MKPHPLPALAASLFLATVALAGNPGDSHLTAGSAMLSNMERLFQLDSETMAFSESSYDRRGLNVDLPHQGLGNPYPTYLGGEDWSGTTQSRYPARNAQAYRSFLNDISLKIYWDDASTPAVDACLSGFFAQSRFGLDYSNHSVVATSPVWNEYKYEAFSFDHHSSQPKSQPEVH